MPESRKELVLTVVGVLGLALIVVKAGGRAGLDLLWLYAVATVLAAAIVGEHFYRRRRRRQDEQS